MCYEWIHRLRAAEPQRDQAQTLTERVTEPSTPSPAPHPAPQASVPEKTATELEPAV